MSKENKWAIILEADKCIDCKACTVACKMENHVELGTYAYRIWVAEEETKGEFPNVKRSFQPSQCQQCENPPCVHVCPTHASYQTDDGIVLIDEKKCILCKYCMTACPYDARYVKEEGLVIDKCTFCNHRIVEGRTTACSETCPPKVRTLVDLNNLTPEQKELLTKNDVKVLKPEKGTKPKLYYIK